jgi:acyl-coenzyme A synthetase/AMP-(fatty) acid ligase
VSLDEVERGIAALPLVAEACVVPLDGDRLQLGAVVVLNARGRAELARQAKFRFERLLRRELATGFDWAVVPRRWRFVDAMPADAMGKRRIQDLVALLQAPS